MGWAPPACRSPIGEPDGEPTLIIDEPFFPPIPPPPQAFERTYQAERYSQASHSRFACGYNTRAFQYPHDTYVHICNCAGRGKT